MTFLPSRPAVRRLLTGALASLAVLAAADTGLWVFATTRLESELAAWQASRRAAGWTASSGRPNRSGWPLAAAITVPDTVLSGGDADLPGGLSWQAAQAVLSVTVLHPWRLTIRFPGQQHLRLATFPDIGFTAEQFDLVLPLSTSGNDPAAPLPMGDLSAAGLRATLPTGALGIAALALHAATRPAATRGEAALNVTGSAQGITLPPLPGGRPWPPGPDIAAASFDAALTGPLPGPGPVAARAASWRDGGGTLVVRHLLLRWGPLDLSGSATMTLDNHLQPAGAATATLAGYDATLDAIASSGALAPRAVQAIKAVLAILARPAQGGPRQVELPVTLRDRTLAAGAFPLLRLPEFLWP